MTEMKVIADKRHSKNLPKQNSSYFIIPTHEETEYDDSFRGKCTHMIHSFKFQVSWNFSLVITVTFER